MKIAIALAWVLAAGIAAQSIDNGKGYPPVPDAYIQAKEKIFSEASVTLSDNIEDNDLVHVLMEKWMDDCLVLLVVKKDGTARLIDSAGRNIIASVRNAKQRKICSAYFRDAEKAGSTVKTLLNPVPEKGRVMFYFFTVNRQYRFGNNEETLRKGNDRMYASAQACLAEVLKAEK